MTRTRFVYAGHQPVGTVPVDADGNVIDDAYTADSVADLRRAVGRPSLSDTGESPQIRARVPAELRDRAKARADAEGVSLSELTREALEAYLAS